MDRSVSMKFILLSILLFFGLAAQGQNYTITVDTNTCRISFTSGQLNYHFLAEKSRYITRNGNTILFDDRRSIGTNINRITNYATNAELRADVDSWFETCNVVSAPVVPPGLTPVFANQKSIDLDGVAEYVTVADANDLSMIEGGSDIPFTVSAWVHWNGTSARIITKDNGSTLREWIFLVVNFGGNYYPSLLLVDNAGTGNSRGRNAVGTSPLPLNKWFHLAGTYDGRGGANAEDGIDIYVNGIAVDIADENAGSYTSMGNKAVGLAVGATAIGGNLFNGKLDQVCIFRNVELTLPEIKELMTIRDVTQFTYYDSLVLYQEYDSPDSTQANGIVDLSPAGNHGTMQSGEYTDLNVCVEWPYSYQLDSNTSYSNLTPMQSSVESDSSYGGFGWDFDGTAEYIEVADNNLLSFGDGVTDSPFSISLYVDIDQIGNRKWIGKGAALASFEWVLYNSGANVYWILGDASTGVISYVRSTPGATIGQYGHWVATYDGGGGATAANGLKIYFNGESLPLETFNNASYVAMEDGSADVNIGRQNNGAGYLDGRLSDVVLWDKELSAAEVKAIYNRHAPRNETNESLAGNIVGYWRGYNSTNVASGVLDQSGNNLHGTPTNMEPADFQYTYPRQIFDADTAGSVDFDGTTEYISIADSDSLSMTDGSDVPFSISAWVNVNTAGTAEKILAKNEAGVTEYVFYLSSGKPTFYLYDESASAYIGVQYNVAISAGVWHNISVAYNGNGSGWPSGWDLYLDGARVSNTNFSSGAYVATENTNAEVNIGYDQSGDPMNGKISHVTIMKNTQISPCEAQEIYNDGSPVDPRNWTFWNDNFIHYKLDQSEDLESTEGVTNISPNGSCNGTATNMTNAANKITTSFPTN